MSDAGPFVAWLAFAWVLFVIGNSLSGLVDAWRTRALARADKTRAQTAALAHEDDGCDVDGCEVFRCESCDRHAHSVGMPDGWAFDEEDGVYLCAGCKEADHGETQDGVA